MEFFILLLLIYFRISNVHAGDCDHLERYPIYSEMQLNNFSLTSWDKPWIPELDWLNSYLNLSMYEDKRLDGLAVGYKITKYARYQYSSYWGCILSFRWDADLADAYSFEHYANTNETMPLCSPFIPMQPELFIRQYKMYTKYSLLFCGPYRPGLLKEIYQEGDLSYIWHTSGGVPLRIALVAATIIFITGGFGNFLILRSIYVNKELQTPTNLFLASLAVADLLITLFLPIERIRFRYFRVAFRLTVPGCCLMNSLAITLFVSSFYHLTAISFERYLMNTLYIMDGVEQS